MSKRPAPATPDRRSLSYVTAFARGLKVIEAFGPENRRMTVADVAARVDLDRAVARRLLLTLCAEGLAKAEGKHFELTPKILRLGYSYLASIGIGGALQPYLDELSAQLGETVSVSLLEGEEVVFVARSEVPGRRMAFVIAMGMRLPAFLSASGRILLSAKPEAEIRALLDQAEIPRLTPNTITSKKQLLAVILKAAADGYATSREELELGLFGVSVLVRNRAGQVIGSLNASANATLVNEDRVRNVFVPELRDCAEKLSDVLL
ncbi:IclR family transcriptional regulator domain-containing protein [Chelatococcus asaccharovorans]|uniref:IclR family transcriptional regulator n=1 Tax=Chelatococcus asaccharovorans TaxID=28210 RepID=A0A2V3U8E1_9HYPH|nr:IclR family transcriptional regulator C-terminal domain-containing protein [Chelatococcus asaccharovorans]MBS7706033.1 helix-turn-helix domain-containing protein [Chelatococcus asaccharovorans]PXW59056.1 IclR family transcriptional regulator [Chelatococcus asaccharovorans]CAH1659624.1 IclR family transcriptional regulator [Chelatococcus asaccharovorans]CAH1684121.1 IclR family transcriptional regulator [Chelatococcus asaccharovorans]